MRKTISLVVLLLTLLAAEPYEVFSLMNSSGSPVSRGLHGGGSAILQGPLSISLNPALVAPWQGMYQKRFVFSAVAGKVSDDGILAGGALSYELTEDNYVTAEFLFRNSDKYASGEPKGDKDLLRATLAISGPLVKEREQELYLGINLAYLHHDDDLSYGALPVTAVKKVGLTNPTLIDSTTLFYEVDTLGSHKEEFLTMDVGFFQLDMGKSMTFSLVAENVLGYRWVQNVPTVLHDTTLTTSNDTTLIVDSASYEVQEYSTKWINGDFKSILVGGTSRIPIQGSDIVLNIPLDMRFWGFLSKDMRKKKSNKLKHRVELYTGLELFKGNTFTGRFGYAWRNAEYRTDETGAPIFKPEHLFAGGATFKVQNLLIDAFWAKGELGGGLTFGF